MVVIQHHNTSKGWRSLTECSFSAPLLAHDPGGRTAYTHQAASIVTECGSKVTVWRRQPSILECMLGLTQFTDACHA